MDKGLAFDDPRQTPPDRRLERLRGNVMLRTQADLARPTAPKALASSKPTVRYRSQPRALRSAVILTFEGDDSLATSEPNDQPAAVSAFLEEREILIAAACRIVESRAVAEEIVQESWLRWTQKDYASGDARPVFRRIVSNLAVDWVRRRRRETLILRQTTRSEQDCRDAERIVIAREDLQQMIAALAALPPRTVTAFRMSRLEGKTYAEIARQLDTVPSRVHGYVVKALATIATVLID